MPLQKARVERDAAQAGEKNANAQIKKLQAELNKAEKELKEYKSLYEAECVQSEKEALLKVGRGGTSGGGLTGWNADYMDAHHPTCGFVCVLFFCFLQVEHENTIQSLREELEFLKQVGMSQTKQICDRPRHC